MPWTETTRLKYSRGQLRYASDTTGEEWALIAPYMPPPRPLGHPRTTNLRLFVDAIFYVAAPGRRWRTLPKDFPPYSTAQNYFYPWREDGTWERIHHALVMAAREAEGREASPTVGVIDSQSVKITESGDPRSYDAGQRTKSRKLDIVTDTMGLLLAMVLQGANIQDRDGAVPLIQSMRDLYP